MSLFSYQNRERSSKLLQFPNDDNYLQKKLRQFKKSSSGCVSTLSKVINKLTKHINSNSDIDCIKRYESRLKNAIKNIRDITTKLHEIVKDENEI